MSLYEKIINKEESIALIGLGYVGMPIAVKIEKKGLDVIGFDLNKEKIELYKNYWGIWLQKRVKIWYIIYEKINIGGLFNEFKKRKKIW